MIDSLPPWDEIIALDGDLLLKVSEGTGYEKMTTAFLVIKSTLCLSSPFFRKRLSEDLDPAEEEEDDDDDDESERSTTAICGPETDEDEMALLDLGDENVKVVRIFLNIIHLQHDDVPKRLESTDFVAMALFCDTYNLGRALGCWPRVWMNGLCNAWVPGTSDRCLLPAWVFRLAKPFYSITNNLFINTYLSPEGDFNLIGPDRINEADGLPCFMLGIFSLPLMF